MIFDFGLLYNIVHRIFNRAL